MSDRLREPTLETLGLGGVLEIFRDGELPADAGSLVDSVFGTGEERGSMVISGAGGIVGSGKAMQLGSRLEPFGVPLVALDLAGAPDGITGHYSGLVRAFGKGRADAIMENIVRVSYDGQSLPEELDRFHPRFLLEAIPEVLELKRSHYRMFRERYPDITIRSVTSGFPAEELGVGVAHPAYPHEINKVWEIVEEEPSDVTRLFWALGLIPMPMEDHWSFVLDVLFCGITAAGLRYHDTRNMPFWKLDKFIRKHVGPNPFRAHDAIGARGADTLTWSCLHHLEQRYGGLFEPGMELSERKDTGQDWYPPDHFRPVVDWPLSAEEEKELRTWLLGPLYQMSALMLHEDRAHLAYMNLIGELCAQFRRGVLALMRDEGAQAVVATVEAYHELFPRAADSPWHPGALEALESPAGRQLYVNAEHDGQVGVVTIGRESYNRDVDIELNRALDWLLEAGVESVIVSGDFHLSTQLVGADTSEFFPALEEPDAGFRISSEWSRTARRLHREFRTSVGFVHGKRCLGGMLELLSHCHYLVAVQDASLGFPEVTLPVVPGMEGCHWPLRRTDDKGRSRILELLLSGRPIPAEDAVGWLVDAAQPLEDALATAWTLATGDGGPARRDLQENALEVLPDGLPDLPPAAEATEAARKAIFDCVKGSCAVPLSEALDVQSRHSAEFMTTPACRGGTVGREARRILDI